MAGSEIVGIDEKLDMLGVNGNVSLVDSELLDRVELGTRRGGRYCASDSNSMRRSAVSFMAASSSLSRQRPSHNNASLSMCANDSPRRRGSEGEMAAAGWGRGMGDAANDSLRFLI